MTESTASRTEEVLVRMSVEDGIATVLLDSARNRNALSARLRDELSAALDDAIADEQVRVIVLTHTGPVFCAGADLKEAATPGRSGATELFEKLWNAPKPVIARLAGSARAGGVGLVAACDLAVAAEQVSFAFTEVRIGVAPAVISVLLRERMPAAALLELLLTGRSFDSRRAVELGLLTAAVPMEQLDERVRELTTELVLGAPGALATTKALLREPGRLRADLAAMEEVSLRTFASAEAAEGMRAFAEKRAPAWARHTAGQDS
jgi:methylglutaconyl-CoA hydratase